jgi:hypothetical protein
VEAIKILLEVWAAMHREQILGTSADHEIDIAELSKPIPARLRFRTAINLCWISVFWCEFVQLFNRVRKSKISFYKRFSD